MAQKLTIQDAEKRHKDLVKGQTWRGTGAKYKYLCIKENRVYVQRFDSHEISHNPGLCPSCSLALGSLKCRFTHEEFVAELRCTNPHIVVKGRYELATIPIECVCKKCGYGKNGEWTPLPSNLRRRKGNCPCCVGHLKKTHKQFVAEMKQKHPTICVEDLYKSSNTKVRLRCLECGYKWSAPPSRLIGKQLSGCSVCGRDRTSSKMSLTIKEAEQRCPDMIKGQKWINFWSKYWFLCKEHGKYLQLFGSHQANVGCPKCANNISLGIQEAERRCPDMLKGQTWRGVQAIYEFVCKTHGVYKSNFSNHHNKGKRCPVCKESRGERSVAGFLTGAGFSFERQKRFLTCVHKKPLPFDFSLVDIKILIEYHGRQHYHTVVSFMGRHRITKKELESIRFRDGIKRLWAKQNGYRLIVVPYTIKNIEGYLNKRLAT